MNRFEKIMLAVLASVIILMVGSARAADAESSVNPNKLPSCPRSGESVPFHNCWGLEVFNNGDKYLGEWQDNELNGQGTYTSTAGDRYIGEFKQGKSNGYLTHTHPNGDQYIGYWVNGKWEGTGVFKFANGGSLSGKFKGGELVDGSSCGSDGSCDTGTFKGGKLHGIGTRNFSNSDHYYGEFVDGLMQGQGVYARKSNGKTYAGIWEKNNLIREADINLPNMSVRTESGSRRREFERQENLERGHPIEGQNRRINQDTAIEQERKKLAEERKRLEEDQRQRDQSRHGQQGKQSVREEVEAAERKEENSRKLEHQRKQDVISRINSLRKHGLIISCPSQYEWIFYQGIINAINDTWLDNPTIVLVATYSAEKNIITWSRGLSRFELHVDNMNIYEKQDDTFNGFSYNKIKCKLIKHGNF